MSDTLKGNVPDLEGFDTEPADITKSMISVVIECSLKGTQVDPIVGSLDGIELGNNPKIDVKVFTDDAFSLVKSWTSGTENTVIDSFQLNYVVDTVHVEGPFKISSIKMMDVNPVTKMCILAVDLIRVKA